MRQCVLHPIQRFVKFLAAFCCVCVMMAWQAEAAGPRTGGTLVFGVESNDFAGFDVLKARGMAISDAFANIAIHERLFRLDERGNLFPLLALSAEHSEDGKSWTIHLRQGVSFHDGTPFNADAVVHHWDRLLDPANGYRGRYLIKPVTSVEKVDEHTVRFHLQHPWIMFPRILASARGGMTSIPSPTGVSEGGQHRRPVGTGPFMFKEWRSADSFVVVRNPAYWQQGKPYLDQIVFRFMPDHQTRYAALEAGDVDMIWMDRGRQIRKAMEDSELKVHHSEDSGAEIIILNTSKPPFNDVRVRQALAHAWDQEKYVRMNYQGCIPAVKHPFGQDIHCGDCGYREYNPEKARALLKEYGEPVVFECLHSNTQRGREIGTILQQFGKAVGMEVSARGLAFGPVVKSVFTGQYQASTWRIPSLFDLGPAMARAFHTRSRANWSSYGNADLDELLARQWTARDSKEREEILCSIAQNINRNVPIIYRGGRHHYIIARPRIKGIPPIQHGVIDVTGAWLEE